MNRNTRLFLGAVLLFFAMGLTVGGCSESGCPDTDGDGLSDCVETDIWHTSTVLADTDGDGISDYDEVVELGFDVSADPFKFNPLVPDVPVLDIDIVSIPDIQLDFKKSASESVTRSEGFSSSSTYDKSFSFTQSLEVGIKVSGSILGPAAETEWKVGVSAEESFGWSDTQTTENSTAYDKTTGQDFEGGRLAVAVNMSNPSNLAFSVDAAVLGAVMMTPRSGEILQPLANLEFASPNGLPRFTLGPGEEAGPFTFAADLLLGPTQSLLKDSTGLVIKVSAFEVTDDEGRSFTHNMTGVVAKTAMVLIDYGGKNGLRPEKHGVATNVNADTPGTTLGETLTNAFAIPYAVGANGLTDVRGVVEDGSTFAFWVVLHTNTVDGLRTRTLYNPQSAAYDFDAIPLKAGDVVQMAYIEDLDGDGLGLREEFAFRTLVDNPDTDGDTISDGDEVHVGWTDGYTGEPVYSSPTLLDTDGDGLNDNLEMAATTNPNHRDTDRDGLLDNVDGFPVTPAIAYVGWTTVDAGYWHAVGVKTDGTLWAWGSNSNGQIGDGCVIGVSCLTATTPVQVPVLGGGTAANWVAAYAGGDTSFAINSLGELWAWGRNDYGQLGLGNTTDQTTMQRVASPSTDWAFVGPGPYHTTALRTTATTGQRSLWAWGANHNGQLGITSATVQFNTPQPVGAATNWATVGAGGWHTMALNQSDQIFAAGYNRNGQLVSGYLGNWVSGSDGPDTAYWLFNNSSTLTQIAGIANRLSVGETHNQVINSTSDLFGSGNNQGAQAGVGLGRNYAECGNLYLYSGDVHYTCIWHIQHYNDIPEWLFTGGNGANMAQVSAGVQHSLGIGSNGALYSWGSNTWAQLGNGGYEYANVPTVTALSSKNDWVLVSAGYGFSLGLDAAGHLWGWGQNVYGQLADPIWGGYVKKPTQLD